MRRKIAKSISNKKETNQKGKFKKKCRACPQLIFRNDDEYLLHIRDQHDGKTVGYHMCSDCGKQFKTKSELTHHINSKCGTIKQYKCKECGQELMTAGSLHNHMRRHSGVRKFMCNFCAKLFFTAGQLKVHERMHTVDKAFICDVCGKGFCHRQSLITHSTLHTGIKPFQCENCGNSFSCVGNLLKHRRTHADTCGAIPLTTHRVQHPTTKLKVKINTPENTRLKAVEKKKLLQEKEKAQVIECGNTNTESSETIFNVPTEKENERFAQNTSQWPEETPTERENGNSKHDSLSDITNHNETVEDSNSPNEVLNKKFNSPDRISPKERPKKKEPFSCRLCPKKYATSKYLQKHEKTHEETDILEKPPTIKKPFKCSCCKTTFQTKDDCIVHQQNEHADKLTCFECDKIFANPDSLRCHQNTLHKGQRRKVYCYVCDKCGKQFKQRALLKDHEEDNCGTGPQFQCQICHKHFASVHSRRSHMRVHDPEKKLLCKFCGKSFHWKGQLKIHERRHTGEKPFNCLYCPKTFAYRESLITHSSLHTGIKPHLCEACGSRFSCIGNLLKHRVSHTSTCGVWYEKNKNN